MPAFTIHAGDVIYYDFPKSNREPRLDSYRDTYCESWFEDRFQRFFLAHRSHYMTFDDHEIVDDVRHRHYDFVIIKSHVVRPVRQKKTLEAVLKPAFTISVAITVETRLAVALGKVVVDHITSMNGEGRHGIILYFEFLVPVDTRNGLRSAQSQISDRVPPAAAAIRLFGIRQ